MFRSVLAFVCFLEQVGELKVRHEQDLQEKAESHAEALARLDIQLNEKVAG